MECLDSQSTAGREGIRDEKGTDREKLTKVARLIVQKTFRGQLPPCPQPRQQYWPNNPLICS